MIVDCVLFLCIGGFAGNLRVREAATNAQVVRRRGDRSAKLHFALEWLDVGGGYSLPVKLFPRLAHFPEFPARLLSRVNACFVAVVSRVSVRVHIL